MDTDLLDVASPILEAVIGKLDLRFREAVSLYGRDVSTLRMNIDEILTCVLVAESARDKTDGWLDKVKLAAYEADDLFDHFPSNNSEPDHLSGLLFNATTRVRGGSDIYPLRAVVDLLILLLAPQVLEVQSFFTTFRKIKNLSVRFEELLREGKKSVPGADDVVSTCSAHREHIQSRSFHVQVVNELVSVLESKSNNALGMHDDTKNLVERLVRIDEEFVQVSVIPIVGQAGIGKTTLARMAFNDKKVLEHFELRTWVCTSPIANKDEFASSIAKGIVESVTGVSCQVEDKDELYDLARDALESERSLVVLDDVPFLDYKTWQHISKSLFCTVALGSKVIITTCRDDFREFPDTEMGEPCRVSPLSNEDSRSLFTSLAFDSSRVTEKIEIEAAEDIILGCEGNPLSLNIMGSCVRFFREESEWLSFRSHYKQIWDSSSRHALLSYFALPPHLKQCFAYCSVFLRDCVIEKEKVIRMWIAEGLIQPTEEKKTLEDIGNDYFRELLCRSFFKDSKHNDFGDITECRIGGVSTVWHNLSQG